MAKFEVYADRSGQWRWRFIANNGKIVADSAKDMSTRLTALMVLRS